LEREKMKAITAAVEKPTFPQCLTVSASQSYSIANATKWN